MYCMFFRSLRATRHGRAHGIPRTTRYGRKRKGNQGKRKETETHKDRRVTEEKRGWTTERRSKVFFFFYNEWKRFAGVIFFGGGMREVFVLHFLFCRCESAYYYCYCYYCDNNYFLYHNSEWQTQHRQGFSVFNFKCPSVDPQIPSLFVLFFFTMFGSPAADCI